MRVIRINKRFLRLDSCSCRCLCWCLTDGRGGDGDGDGDSSSVWHCRKVLLFYEAIHTCTVPYLKSQGEERHLCPAKQGLVRSPTVQQGQQQQGGMVRMYFFAL